MTLARLKDLSVSSWILIGLGLGAVCGIVFGEEMRSVSILGTIFIKLTQITVMPYILLSLIHGIGSLNKDTAERLATRGLPILLVLWALPLAVFYAMPLAFPTRTTASFYDPTIFPDPSAQAPAVWDTYIPANPFSSLADGRVPAVVVFSLCVGIALIGVARKEGFLNGIGFMNTVLSKINRTVIKYTAPVGVFALVGNTVGTLSASQFKDVTVFFAVAAFASVVLAFCVLPLAITALTRLTYRELMSELKAPLLLAVTSGNLFITLPMLSEATRNLLSLRQKDDPQVTMITDTLTPLSYTIPTAGGLSPLLFIVFAAWFAGKALAPGQFVELTLAGVLSLFGSAKQAVPNLLSMLGLPSESFNLYLASEQLVRNIGNLMSVMGMATLTLGVGAAVLGQIKVRPHRVLVALGVSAVLVLGGTLGMKAALGPLTTGTYRGYDILQSMKVDTAPTGTVYKDRSEAPPPPTPIAEADSLLKQIQTRRVLRVGYAPSALPFSYFNKHGELVGFDIERTYHLAEVLRCESVQFIPVDRQRFAGELQSGLVDIVVGAVRVTPDKYAEVDFTNIYLTLNVALVCADQEVKRYASAEHLSDLGNIRLAVEEGSYFASIAASNYPQVIVVPVKSPMDFFKGGVADALLTSAEEGSAYTLMYPAYEMVAPSQRNAPMFLAYAVPKGQPEWVSFLDNWLTMEKESGGEKIAYDYWITGKTAEVKQPRWSVIRNVLHWVD
jgi:Na+/H+-dicarboxylate symporter/ABC-type amino acid transport substrate-binding protein